MAEVVAGALAPDIEATAWVDHDHPPMPRDYEKCPKCGNDLRLRHHCPPDIDKVAEAIWRADYADELSRYGGVVTWLQMAQTHSDRYRRMATAAVAAMGWHPEDRP